MTDPLVLRDPLPAGWRRCSSLGCGAPGGHEPPCVPEAVPPVAVAGPEVDVGAEVRGGAPTLADVAAVIDRAQRSLDAVSMPCAETMLAIDALESAESLVADLRGAQPTRAELSATVSAKTIAVSATRAERIEAAARAFVAAGDAMRAAVERWDAVAADAAATATHAGMRALRAALCTCNGHGPDPACVDHGAALRAIHGAPT